MPVRVAVRGLGQPADQDALDLRKLVGRRLVHVELAADHVGVHARAADVLADLVDDQQMDLIERQPRHQLLGQDQQLLLARLELLRRDALDLGRFVVAILDDAQAGHDAARSSTRPATLRTIWPKL